MVRIGHTSLQKPPLMKLRCGNKVTKVKLWTVARYAMPGPIPSTDTVLWCIHLWQHYAAGAAGRQLNG
eukprot:scaffold207022_cov21-Tisochrysis_lutea.AAC.1